MRETHESRYIACNTRCLFYALMLLHCMVFKIPSSQKKNGFSVNLFYLKMYFIYFYKINFFYYKFSFYKLIELQFFVLSRLKLLLCDFIKCVTLRLHYVQLKDRIYGYFHRRMAHKLPVAQTRHPGNHLFFI